MIHHPALAQQLATARQRELLDHARRHELRRAARFSRPAPSARSVPAAWARPRFLRRLRAVLSTSH